MNGIKINNDGFEIVNGDFVIADTDSQNIDFVLRSTLGQSGNVPFVGVNIFKYLNSPKVNSVLNSIKKRIKLSLKKDGFEIDSINARNFPSIEIKAELNE